MARRSKKDMIAELLSFGRSSDKQIARQVNTTVAYVQKIKTVLKKEGRLIVSPQTAQVFINSHPHAGHLGSRIQR